MANSFLNPKKNKKTTVAGDRGKEQEMSKTSGKWEIRTVDILVVIIMVLTGSTSLLAWGSKGFTDWNVMGWFGYAPEPAPAPSTGEELQAVTSGYNLVMPAVTSRAISSEAEAEFNEYISRSGTDETTDAFLAKVTVKNELDGETVSGKTAGAKFIYAQSAIAFAIMLPREIPFVHLQTGNIYKDTKCEYKGSSLNNFYKNAFDYWDMYVLTSGGKPTASTLGAITVTYQIEDDPNYEVPLPEEPTKEGYTFVGWYYGTESEHGENCTAYNGEHITAETNLHAHFEINRYTVTYDVAGGKEIQPQEVDWSTELTPPTPERTGYDFKGWYLSDGTEYTGQAIKEDTTLTARWGIKVFTVTFYVDGEVYATKEVNYGTTFTELSEQAKDLNLKVLTVMTEQGELPLDEYANIRITENYSVTSTSLTATEQVQHFFKVYPWVFVVAGAGLSAMILIIDAVRHRPAKQQTTRKRR